MNINKKISSESYGVLKDYNVKSDLDMVAEQVRMLGYGILSTGFDNNKINAISEAFNRTQKHYLEKFGYERLSAQNEQHTIRAMLTHGELIFRQLATNRKLINLIKKLILGKFILNQQNGIINPSKTKYQQGLWHRDLPYQHFVSSRPLAINALYCVDDFTLDNGSTIVLPASHKSEAFPSSAFVDSNQVKIIAKAGNFIVLDCMTYHKGGANQTNESRRAINHVYTIPFIKQQVSLSHQMASFKLSRKEREVFGCDNPEPANIEDFLFRHAHG